jgi:organic hydroperoxide reductase OsmC/OhrA
VASRARRFHHTVKLDSRGRILAEDGPAVSLPVGWSPEHLLLAALVSCTLKSLRYYAKRVGVEVSASAETSSTVSLREEDGLYAVVELAVVCDVDLAPEPAPEVVEELLQKAERGCFIGNSLRVTPSWTWHVNGRPAVADAHE